MIAQLFVGFHATFEVFHHRQRVVILGFQFGDALVQIILVEQIFLLQEDQSLCHGFEVVLLCPMLIACAFTLGQLCLNVNQFPDFIRFQRNRVLAFGICGQGGEYGISVIVVTEMFRPDELRSAGRQIAELYQIDLLNGSKERVSEAEYWARRRGQQKLDLANAALDATGQPPQQKKFETVKDILRKQISSVLYRATSFEDFSDKLMQQYGITVKESRGQLSYLPAGRTKFIRAKHLGDKFEKELVLATLQENAERKRTVKPTPDRIGKLVNIQAKLKQGKGIGYERWAKKHNLKAMSQTLLLLQEKGLLNEDALNQRIVELETKYHDALAVVKDLEGRMKTNNELRYHITAYTNTKNIAQQLKAAKRPAAFEEQHRAELTAYRTAAAYLKANNITKLPSPKKLEAEYNAMASEKAKFYEQYKEAKEELLKLKTAKQNVASFFREEEQTQQER